MVLRGPQPSSPPPPAQGCQGSRRLKLCGTAAEPRRRVGYEARPAWHHQVPASRQGFARAILPTTLVRTVTVVTVRKVLMQFSMEVSLVSW